MVRRQCRTARSCTRCTSAPSRRRGPGRPRAAELDALADLGITVIEMMPIADFAGRFGWGYDGVNLYAPTRLYGTPDDLRAFVDRAHALGPRRDPRRRLQPPRARRQLSVGFLPRLLHRPLHERLGRGDQFRSVAAGTGAASSRTPATGSTSTISTACASTRRRTSSDASPEHVIAELIRQARAAAGARAIFVVAENEPQDTHAGPRPGGGRVRRRRALERRLSSHGAGGADREARGVLPRLQGLGAGAHLGREVRLPLSGAVVRLADDSAAARPALDLPPRAFVAYLENHDQVANTPFGTRLHQVAVAGPASGADRADAARTGDADAVPGAGVRGLGAVPVFRRSQGGAARRRCRRAGGSSCRSFPA